MPQLRAAARSTGPLLPAPQRVHALTDASRVDRERLLLTGDLELLGRLTEASNATFLCRVADDEMEQRAVYKPVRGERPLDDFPTGTLANRERAAYLLSQASGWDIVPPTVLRDGPLGHGMVQWWVDVDEDCDPLQLVVESDPRLRPIALFDAIANNADRKAGHLLPVAGGHVHGCDHGICFAAQPKLRTVLWAWRGSVIEAPELAVVEAVRTALEGDLGARLRELLSQREVDGTRRRADALLSTGRFPQPDPKRPAIPWPPY